MKNHEGYSDPTASTAIANVMREQRRNKSMELKDTISMMESDDYKERFKAEYYQTKIRYTKLKNMVDNWDSLDFKPTCKREIYLTQLDAMKAYMDILKLRAIKEDIKL